MQQPLTAAKDGKKEILLRFGIRLRNLRKGKKLTREALADKTGIKSVSQIQNYEKGIYFPASVNLVALCIVLDVDCETLLFGEKFHNFDSETKLTYIKLFNKYSDK